MVIVSEAVHGKCTASQSVEKVLNFFRKNPRRGFFLFSDLKRSENSPSPAFLNAFKTFRPLRRSTKGSAFGYRKPLKRLDLNFNKFFAATSKAVHGKCTASFYFVFIRNVLRYFFISSDMR